MENLPNEVLSKIFSYFDVGERVLFESVCPQFRDAMDYHDYDTIDIPHLEKSALRPIAYRLHKSAPMDILSSRHVASEKKKMSDVEFHCWIFEKLVPKFGPKLTTVRFGDHSHFEASSKLAAIEAEPVALLLRLSKEYGSNITAIDFGRREVRIEALSLLPQFEHLRELTIFDTNNRFSGILRRLKLTTLKIGGFHSPYLIANPQDLRELHFFGIVPEKLMKTKAVLPRVYPNLEVLMVNIRVKERTKCFDDFPTGANADDTIRKRVAYFNGFKNLRQSNLFCSDYLCLPYMVATNADAVERIEELIIDLPADGAHQQSVIYLNALDKIDSWPRFFQHFRSIRSIRISNASNDDLKFRAVDLFHLGSLDQLRKLELDGLKVTIDDGEREYIGSMRTEVDNRLLVEAVSLERSFQSLEYLKINVAERPCRRSGRDNIVYDLFLAYVTVNSDRLKQLEMNYISSDGWSYLIRYVDRLGSRCRLETIRVKHDGYYRDYCAAIDLNRLTTLNHHDVIWSSLRELSVWCEHHYYCEHDWCDHHDWGENHKPVETDMEKIKDIGIKFPRLRCFHWPEPNMSTGKFRMFADGFPTLREIRLPISSYWITQYFDLIAEYSNLECVRLTDSGRTTLKRFVKEAKNAEEFERMVRKRREIMAERGLRETEFRFGLGSEA